MRNLLIALFFILLLSSFVDAGSKRTRRLRKRENPPTKIFAFLDEKKDGKIPVDQIKPKLQKILPLSDDKKIDDNKDGFVTLSEFKKFYQAQYNTWKEKHSIKS